MSLENQYDDKPFLYVKWPGDKRFSPVDWRKGVRVVNRIHATMFTKAGKKQAERDLAHPNNSDLTWEWRA